MSYYRESGQVEYRSKDGSKIKVFDALEWMAAMLGAAKLCEDGCSHIPGKGEQMARYGACPPLEGAANRCYSGI